MGGRHRTRALPALALAFAVGAVAPWPVAAADPLPSEAPASSEPAPSPDPTQPAGPPSPEPTVPADPTLPPDPTVPPDPLPTPPADPEPQPIPVELNLYRSGAVVRQATSYWCVPANAMTMINLITGSRDRSYATQKKYDRWLKRYNRYRYRSRGNDVNGWATLVDYRTPGPWRYDDRSFATQAAAIDRIVEALDRTRHPVGIVVDRGTHAWTVIGYRATVLPGQPESRTITGLYVSGSLRRDPHPYAFLPIGEFRRRFSRYHEWQRRVVWEGRYVIVSE